MSSKKKKKKKRKSIKYRDVQLNIMPFIDVFSLLNTFLLTMAVFLNIGVIEVQIPFLTSAPPPKDEPEKSCDIKVDMEKEKIEVTATDCKGVETAKTFKPDKPGVADLHKHMVVIRQANPEFDKVQFFTEDDVIWEDMAAVLDAIKLRLPGDPMFTPKSNSEADKAMAAEFVYPKVVLASVML